MGVSEVMKEVSNELERLVSTKTVIGESVETAGKTIIPVTKVSFGFGSGGGEGKKGDQESGFGGGGGAGAKIEPVAFLVVSEDDVSLLSVSGTMDFGKLLGAVPDVIEKIKSAKKKSKKDNEEAEVKEESGKEGE